MIKRVQINIGKKLTGKIPDWQTFDLPCHSWRGSNLRSAVACFSQERSCRYNFSYKVVIFCNVFTMNAVRHEKK
jgi:hypothetical protein